MKALNKALNLAIARTVGQLARHGGEVCHPPMLMALETHLDALLEMERKQLEAASMKFATLTGDGTGKALPELAQHLRTQLHPGSTRAMDDWTPEMVDRFNNMEPERVTRGMHIEAGDTLTRIGQSLPGRWTHGSEYSVLETNAQEGSVLLRNDDGLVRWIAPIAVEHHFSVRKKQTEPSEPAPPAPDVINMTDPANWLPGDRLLRKIVRSNFPHFTSGREYTVTSNGPDVLKIMGNTGVEVSYPHKPFCEPASNFFTWLRHGEAQQ